MARGNDSHAKHKKDFSCGFCAEGGDNNPYVPPPCKITKEHFAKKNQFYFQLLSFDKKEAPYK